MKATLLTLLCTIPPTPTAENLVGYVSRVSDGDTVTLVHSEDTIVKIRLAGIDAPEKSQNFGLEARNALADLLLGKSVRATVDAWDRYGRAVARLYLGGTDVSAEQVRHGLAWVYRQYSDDPILLRLEEKARNDQTGLWADENPTPPWIFRRNRKRCRTKQHCYEMENCDEALFYLRVCGLARLDGDQDSVPCEALCRD